MMTKPIPKNLKNEMLSDKFYSQCCLCEYQDKLGACSSGKIDLHHNLQFGSTGRVNEKFAILPLCVSHHAIEKRTDVKERLDWIMWGRATHDERTKYVVFEHIVHRLNYLTSKYGKLDNN